MSNYYLIDGYYVDDGAEFTDYLVKDDHTVGDDDDDIFFYGLTEEQIKREIELGGEDAIDFVITAYRKVR